MADKYGEESFGLVPRGPFAGLWRGDSAHTSGGAGGSGCVPTAADTEVGPPARAPTRRVEGRSASAAKTPSQADRSELTGGQFRRRRPSTLLRAESLSNGR